MAIRIWRRNPTWALAIGVIAAVALVVNLSNSLGAIAGRGDEKTAERMKSVQSVKDERSELARITREREAMPAFKATTAEAVQFARDAVASAERTAKAECDKRGTRCRERESEEQSRRTELAAVVALRALTERAAQLDVQIGRIRERLAKVAPVVNVNPQASALAQVFRLPDADAAVYQYLAVAIVVELLIAGSFIAFELMRETGVASPATPALAVVAGVVPEGEPERFCVEGLVRKAGERVPPDRVYPAYEAWCRQHGLRAVGGEVFIDRFFAACEAAGIAWEKRAGIMYLAGVPPFLVGPKAPCQSEG